MNGINKKIDPFESLYLANEICEACKKNNHKECLKPKVIDADSNEVDYECCCGAEQWVYNIGKVGQPKCDDECYLFKCRTCLLENVRGICRRQFKPLNQYDDAGDVMEFKTEEKAKDYLKYMKEKKEL